MDEQWALGIDPVRRSPGLKDEYNCRVNTRKTAYLFGMMILVLLLPGAASPAQAANAQGSRAVVPLQQATQTPASAQQPIAPVQTLPPNEDGSITHVVRYGETLIDIAAAYGITLSDLYARNRSLDPNKPVYYEGQVLVIRPAFTPTPFITETYTPPPPTNTPRPTRTPRPTSTATTVRTPTPVLPTRTPTSTPFFRIPTLEDLGPNRSLIGVVMIVVSAIALVILAFTAFFPLKK